MHALAGRKEHGQHPKPVTSATTSVQKTVSVTAPKPVVASASKATPSRGAPSHVRASWASVNSKSASVLKNIQNLQNKRGPARVRPDLGTSQPAQMPDKPLETVGSEIAASTEDELVPVSILDLDNDDAGGETGGGVDSFICEKGSCTKVHYAEGGKVIYGEKKAEEEDENAAGKERED